MAILYRGKTPLSTSGNIASQIAKITDSLASLANNIGDAVAPSSTTTDVALSLTVGSSSTSTTVTMPIAGYFSVKVQTATSDGSGYVVLYNNTSEIYYLGRAHGSTAALSIPVAKGDSVYVACSSLSSIETSRVHHYRVTV